MKIVLALAPVWDSVTPHLAMAFLKSSLQQAGYACKCIDFSIQFRPIMVSVLGDKKAEAYIEENPALYKEWARQILSQSPDIVGFSILGSNLANTILVGRELKRQAPDLMIVCGGPSLVRENLSSIQESLSFADYVIEGEGEKALVEFVKCYERKGDFTQLKQIWHKHPATGQISYTGGAALENIDSIPYPDFTDYDRSLYPCPDRLPMLFSRGCILNCNYCENKWNHLTQRSRSGQNVFDELKHHVKKYGIKEYMFNDDSLISSKTMRQMNEYCDLVLAEGLSMPWSVYGTRVERLITEPFLQKLRASGMERVSLGVESFSSRVQKEMGKSSRYDDADKMCRMFAAQGIRTESWIIYGYPTETDADFDETLQWFVQNPGILSHVTANSFGPNAKYLQDRPGVVVNDTSLMWGWRGLESTIEKRKERFLALIEALEGIRRSRAGQFTFYVGDPLYVKYFSSWTKKDKDYLLKNWEMLENPGLHLSRKEGGLRRMLRMLGIGREEESIVADPQRKEDLEIGDLQEMQDKLYARIAAHLAHTGSVPSPEVETRVDQYRQFFDQVKLHLNDNVSESMLFALALKGPVQILLHELDTHAPEYIAQLVVESAGKYNISYLAGVAAAAR